MKATDLISKLHELIEEHGDLHVFYWTEEMCDVKVQKIQYVDSSKGVKLDWQDDEYFSLEQ